MPNIISDLIPDMMPNILPDTLYWREPLWLGITLLPLLFLWLRQRQRRRQLDRYVERDLQPWVTVASAGGRNTGRAVLQTLAWLCLAVAAAGPRLPIILDPAQSPRPGAVMIVMDLSRSMQADDVYPSRSELARRLPTSWLADSPHQIGVVVFAGEAHLLLPPTHDRTALADIFKAIRSLQLPAHGSQLDEALTLAYAQLDDSRDRRNNRDNAAIIVMTDGDMPETTLTNSLAVIQQQAPTIDFRVLGIGSPAASALADLSNRSGQSGQWLMQDGQVVTTRLDEEALQKLAQAAGGRYQRLDPDYPPALDAIWQAGPVRLSDTQQQQTQWQELFGWFLLPAMLLYLLGFFSPRWPLRLLTPAHKLLLVILALLLPGQVQAADNGNQEHIDGDIYGRAYRQWINQDYETAATLFSRLPGYRGRMGEGSSCFRLQDFDCAISAFSKAAWQAGTDVQRSVATYNLGNSYFQIGDFTTANTLFRDALRYDPHNKTIKNNLAFSEVVAQAVAERLAQTNAQRNGRLGKGWRTTKVKPGSDIAPNTGVTLVEPEDDTGKTGESDPNNINDLLEKGLRFARLAGNNKGGRGQQHGWVRTGNGGNKATDNATLWQRLIEMEKGILTPPEQPVTLPGVLPW